MSAIYPQIDPNGLLEYSVVYTDRALNHMSRDFQQVMNDISAALKQVYHASAVAVVPGSGTFAMEAVARQLATRKRCLILRNGWFSYRWTQILDMGAIPTESKVLKAQAFNDTNQPTFVPHHIDQVVDEIKNYQPDIVFAPHVETASGMILSDDYLKQVAAAVRSIGGIFVLDCIASGTVWIDMEACQVDVLITAPQKGWSGSPCAGVVMLNERSLAAVKERQSSSFACDLGKWLQIMEAYLAGGHAYHATMPTDGLARFRDMIFETINFGLDLASETQWQLGMTIRKKLSEHGFESVAADGYQAPGVVVCYTDDHDIHTGAKFKAKGLQIAKGVPLKCDEPQPFQTFRLGLFGLDKLKNLERTIDNFETALKEIT